MKAIVFSKALKDKTPRELVELALGWGVDGYDLAVRPGYPVNPDNAGKALPEVVKLFRDNGLEVPMVTGNFDLLSPDHPTAEPLLAAMDKADVRLLKLGYFAYDSKGGAYLDQVDRVRRILADWEAPARRYGVRICYHTHSLGCLGSNTAGLAHLLADRDPACVGAYLDTGHLVVEGEPFGTAVAMVRPYLSIVAFKDVLLSRVEKNGHGAVEVAWVQAGQGMVDWTGVFEVLAAADFGGPVSIHCEFEVPKDQPLLPAITREVAFFMRFLNR